MNETIKLDGVFSFKTVNEKKTRFLETIMKSNANDLRVSLAGVTKADSAGLALMIEGVRLANKQAKSLCYFDVPEKLVSLALFCQLDFLIKDNVVSKNTEKF